MQSLTFSVIPAIHGFDVVDESTGHAVDHFDFQHEADGFAADLRRSARSGSAQLCRRLNGMPDPVTQTDIGLRGSAVLTYPNLGMFAKQLRTTKPFRSPVSGTKVSS